MDHVYYLGEQGRTITQVTGFDWTSVVTKTVIIEKPSGDTITKTGAQVTVADATSGTIYVTIEAGDLDETGTYLFQAKAEFASSIRFGDVMSFEVEEVLTGS